MMNETAWKVFETPQRVAGRVVAGRAVQALGFVALLASAAHSAQAADSNLNQLEQLSSSWSDSALEVKLMTDDDTSIVAVDEPVRYQLTAQHGGVCYLVHIDAEDNASLIRPEDCANLGDGQASHFPATGSLKAAAPWGSESVFAFMLNESLPFAEDLLAGSQGFVALESDAQLDSLMSGLRAASEAGQLAVAQTSYDVVQYRTRGIIKAVKSAREPAAVEEPKEVSFAVQSINFEFGSDELTPAGVRQLDEFGSAMADPELATTRLKVAGHTDDLGDEAYNLDLSQRRAASVGVYLKENFQISGDRIEVVGYGEAKPIIEESSRAARAQNRRVEMVLID